MLSIVEGGAVHAGTGRCWLPPLFSPLVMIRRGWSGDLSRTANAGLRNGKGSRWTVRDAIVADPDRAVRGAPSAPALAPQSDQNDVGSRSRLPGQCGELRKGAQIVSSQLARFRYALSLRITPSPFHVSSSSVTPP